MKKRSKIICLITTSIALCVLPMAVKLPTKLAYNPSPSAPVGLYWIGVDGTLKRGAYTVIPTPPAFRMIAAKRHYLPFNVPLVKRIVALSGDQVCRFGETVLINKRPVATALVKDSQGRFLPVWEGCFTLKDDEFFALMDSPDSFDGRYFGPLKIADMVGIATPLITWEVQHD